MQTNKSGSSETADTNQLNSNFDTTRVTIESLSLFLLTDKTLLYSPTKPEKGGHTNKQTTA